MVSIDDWFEDSDYRNFLLTVLACPACSMYFTEDGYFLFISCVDGRHFFS